MGSQSSKSGLTAEEGGECFRQTDDGVLLSKNLVDRMLFKGATASLYDTPLKEKKTKVALPPPPPPPEEEDVNIEIRTECCNTGTSNLNVTQPLSNTICNPAAGKEEGKKYCGECPMSETGRNVTKLISNSSVKRTKVRPICENLQEALVQCYQDNPGQTLNCAQIVRDLRKCVYEPSESFFSNYRHL